MVKITVLFRIGGLALAIFTLNHEIFDNSMESTSLKITLYFQKGCKKKDLDCEKCYPRSYLEKTMFNFDWNKIRASLGTSESLHGGSFCEIIFSIFANFIVLPRKCRKTRKMFLL